MPRIEKNANVVEEPVVTDEQIEVEDEGVESSDDKIRIAFDEATSSGASEDATKMAMILAGATFKNVARLYSQYMVDAGLAMSKEEKVELQSNVLDTGDYDVSTQDGFVCAQNALTEAATGLSDKQAAAIIRTWAKKNGVDCFRKAPSGQPRGGWTFVLFDALTDNPTMTKEELSHMLQNHPAATENSRRHESFYQNLRQFANNVHAKYAAS